MWSVCRILDVRPVFWLCRSWGFQTAFSKLFVKSILFPFKTIPEGKEVLGLAALFLHEGGQRGHIREAVAQLLAFSVELEAEVFLHGQAEFERIYGVEAETAVAEQGFFIADVGGREVFQAEAVDNQLFDFLF